MKQSSYMHKRVKPLFSFLIVFSVLVSATYSPSCKAELSHQQIQEKLNWAVLKLKNLLQAQLDYVEDEDTAEELATSLGKLETWYGWCYRLTSAPLTSKLDYYKNQMKPDQSQFYEVLNEIKPIFEIQNPLIGQLARYELIDDYVQAWANRDGSKDSEYDEYLKSLKEMRQLEKQRYEERVERQKSLLARTPLVQNRSKIKLNAALNSALSTTGIARAYEKKDAELANIIDVISRYNSESFAMIRFLRNSASDLGKFINLPETKRYFQSLREGRTDVLAPQAAEPPKVALLAGPSSPVDVGPQKPSVATPAGEEKTEKKEKVKTRGVPNLNNPQNTPEVASIPLDPVRNLNEKIQISSEDLAKLKGKHLKTIQKIFGGSVSVDFGRFVNAWESIPNCKIDERQGSAVAFNYQDITLFLLHKPHEKGLEIYQKLGQRIIKKLSEIGLNKAYLDSL